MRICIICGILRAWGELAPLAVEELGGGFPVAVKYYDNRDFPAGALILVGIMMVDNIKAYERPSEQARLVGVEDGENEPVPVNPEAFLRKEATVGYPLRVKPSHASKPCPRRTL